MNQPKIKVLFIGAGGYAKSALDSLDHTQYEFCGFIDSFKSIGENHLGFPILAQHISELNQPQDYAYFISVGDNQHRHCHYQDLQTAQVRIISIIDKTALISPNTQFGQGVFIGKMAIVNSDVVVGDNTVINTKALIEHGCRVGKHCNISTNSTLNGDVKIADFAYIGSSSVINGQLSVGENTTVGSGAVVVKSLPANCVAVGVPAKIIKQF